MNWGKWIVVTFVLFATFIVSLVVICIRQDVGLVSSSYYKDELVYQQQMKRISNVSSLEKPPVLKVVNNKLELHFDQLSRIEMGQIKLFRPSNSSMDRIYEVPSVREHQLYFDLVDVQKGMYRAKFKWTMDGVEYYHEEVIFI